MPETKTERERERQAQKEHERKNGVPRACVRCACVQEAHGGLLMRFDVIQSRTLFGRACRSGWKICSGAFLTIFIYIFLYVFLFVCSVFVFTRTEARSVMMVDNVQDECYAHEMSTATHLYRSISETTTPPPL